MGEACCTGGTKERLVYAAIRVFADKGYRGATVRDICREAGGANLNAVNYYFGGKEKLYQVILEALFAEVGRRVAAAVADPAGMAAEEWLRVFLETYCRLLFASGEVSVAMLRIYAMELANPSPFLPEMIERHAVPQTEGMLAVMAGIVGQDAPRAVLRDCMLSVIGQVAYQAMAWPVISQVFPDHPGMEAYWPRLAEHVYRFSMAGLVAVREALAGGDDGA